MIVGIHKNHEGRTIISLCDEDLIGKKIEDNELQLDLTSKFYKGEKKSNNDIKHLISSAYLVNAVGKNAIVLLKEMGLVDDNSLLTIKGVPHAQCLLD